MIQKPQVTDVFLFFLPHVIYIFHTQQLVPSVSELIVAELLYLAYMDRKKEIQMYINSTGTTRADGEVVWHMI